MAPKVLLGGVPFGCDNVGDEAILACAVELVRQVCAEAQITVSTADQQATAEKLQVATCPLLAHEEHRPEFIAKAMADQDVYIWCGATGLSDYPQVALVNMHWAQKLGKKTALWGVGMNDELNPAFFKLKPGKSMALLKPLNTLTMGAVDFVRLEEQRRENRARKLIARYLDKADLVVVRDPESRREVLRCGVRSEVVVGADSALVLQATPLDQVPLSDEVRQVLLSKSRKVGICISAQREISDMTGLVDFLNRTVSQPDTQIVFLPMNPITDSRLMEELRQRMERPERSVVVEGRYEPADVLAIAACLDVVVSSRLHLLILSSVVDVPIIGISRGSKVDNFLNPYGLRSAGSVEACDFDHLWSETQRFLTDPSAFVALNRRIFAEYGRRLDEAKAKLGSLLNS